MKDKIKEILINRLGQVVKDDVLDELSVEINKMVRHNQFLQSDRKDNITINNFIDDTARIGDVFKYRGDYYEITADNTKCGFDGMNCDDCPFYQYGCIKLKGFAKI